MLSVYNQGTLKERTAERLKGGKDENKRGGKWLYSRARRSKT